MSIISKQKLEDLSTVKILQYMTAQAELDEITLRREESYTNKKHRDAFSKLDNAIVKLSEDTGVPEKALHSQVRDAMGFDGWWIPSEVVVNQVLQTVDLIECNHAVVKWLEEIRNDR